MLYIACHFQQSPWKIGSAWAERVGEGEVDWYTQRAKTVLPCLGWLLGSMQHFLVLRANGRIQNSHFTWSPHHPCSQWGPCTSAEARHVQGGVVYLMFLKNIIIMCKNYSNDSGHSSLSLSLSITITNNAYYYSTLKYTQRKKKNYWTFLLWRSLPLHII